MHGPPDADRIVSCVLDGLERYLAEFRDVTRRARERFEDRDWAGMLDDMVERLPLHGRSVDRVVEALRTAHGDAAVDPEVWSGARREYAARIAAHPNRIIAETFFNSVARRVLGTVGKSVETEFDAPALAFDARVEDPPVYRAEDGDASTAERIERVLRGCRFRGPFSDLERDAREAAGRIDRYVVEILGDARIGSIDVVRAVFFRETLAYVIGRIHVHHHVLPLVLTLRHDERGIALDAVLLTHDELSVVFSFTRSHFHVDVENVRDLVVYLKGILPLKPVAELLISLGYFKTGKTELYRSLRDHMDTTIDRFEVARGAEGMVMLVFTLPFYGLVFKIIRDRFAYPKTATRQDVLDSYRRVFTQDRAGRMVEAQEFEGLEFRRERFREDLLEKLLREASGTVTVRGDMVVIGHVYVERKVWPLDLYVREGPPGAAHDVVVDYGRAIKDLARVDVFPGDFLLKNFGVTRHRRVVFYDYDEIGRITECNFRAIPPPRTPEDELSDEPWYTAAPGDIFPEEFERFLGLPVDLATTFADAHGDLFGPEFWNRVKDRLLGGEVLHVYPYPSSKRLR